MADEPDDDEDGEPPSILYRLFGYWVRLEACRLAALAVSRVTGPEEGWAPKVWSLTVFFESYLLGGSGAAAADFGPKEAVELKDVTSAVDG